MPSFNIFGAEDSITVIGFVGDEGIYKSWAEAKTAAITQMTTELSRYTGVFVQDQKYVRMRKLLTHLRGCNAHEDYQWFIWFDDYNNPNVNFPL